MKVIKKKGQITIYIILGLVIFISFIFIYSLTKSPHRSTDKDIKLLYQSQDLKGQVESFISGCANRLLKEAIYYNGKQGFYYYSPNIPVPIPYSSLNIPFYVFYNETFLPSHEEIENELEYYVEDNLDKCINNFKIFNFSGYDFLAEPPLIRVSITDKAVIMNTSYSVKAVYENLNMIEIRDFYRTTTKFDYQKIYSLLSHIVSNLTTNNELIPIGYISDLAEEQGFTYGLVAFGDSSILYILFNEAIEEGPPYFHAFAFDRNPIGINITSFNLPDILPQNAYVGYEFRYNVGNLLNNMTFTDSTELFDINRTSGEIRFTPSIEDVGYHLIEILASDNDGNADSSLMELNILLDNKAPEILPIGTKEFKIGKEYSFDVKVKDPENDKVLYSLNSTLQNLSINPLSGNINFKPSGQEGYYNVKIDVIDVFGNKDTEYFTVIVKK